MMHFKGSTCAQIEQGDCLDLMRGLPDRSVDLILCDLPYGTTQNKWDCVVSLPSLWGHYRRIVKANGAIVLSAQAPFDKALGASNLSALKYEWVWEKENGTGHLNAKKAPLKSHENLLVFYERQPTYNPQFEQGKPYTQKSGRGSSNYGAQPGSIIESDGRRYPKTVLRFNRDKSKLHPTQKPVALMEYLIKTYTNEGDVVLDNCMGSGTTGVACMNTGRHFIGYEMNDDYFAIANWRIFEASQL